MSGLLHVDSSLQGDNSVSRRFTAKAAEAWRRANPDGTVVYRDLAADPLPHYDADAHSARMTPPEQHTPGQAAAWRLAQELVDEVRAADTIIVGAPMYNWAPPTTLKTWIDHLIAPGLSRDAETQEGLLGGRRLIVISTRGGGYGPGTPREGWNFVDGWIRNVFSSIGLDADIIEIEMTLADVVPALAEFKGMAAENRARAEEAIASLLTPAMA